MQSPILTTRLFIPPLRPEVVLRPRLLELLDEGLRSKLVIVSASAGFGKTTIVSQWLAETGLPAAWISLDSGDSDLPRFLDYFVAALQKFSPTLGQQGADATASVPAPLETTLTAIINDIALIKDDFVLVLDDYHEVDSKAVDEALGFLLDHLPPQMHLVLTTREDPQLPLARLRAGGQLVELRDGDLRFTLEETTSFLNDAMELELSTSDLASLEARTEGWIAGLQLAALSLRGRDDRTDFVRAFTGDNRYIVDYLIEEVLDRQTEEVRGFLLRTSLLERLSAPLCDALLEVSRSKELLASLDRSNLFLIALDDQRRWFRYHHLFADVLHAHIIQEFPEEVSPLHQRASAWFEENGFPREAIQHALAAENFERSAALIEIEYPAMDAEFRTSTWLGWFDALPEKIIRHRPVLLVNAGWSHLNAGDLDSGELWLDRGEELLLAEAEEKRLIADAGQFEMLGATIATARAYISQSRGDIPTCIDHARDALERLPEKAGIQRGQVGSLLALAYWTLGDLDAAQQSFTTAQESMLRGGSVHFAVTMTYALADLAILRGRLDEAREVYESSLRLIEKEAPGIQGTSEIFLGFCELAIERGELDEAEAHLVRSEELGASQGLPNWAYRSGLIKSRLAEARGDYAQALACLDEAAPHYYVNPVPDMSPIAALRARLALKEGRLDDARRWVEESGLRADDQAEFIREFEYITLARFLLAQGGEVLSAALMLLQRLLESAQSGGRSRRVVEILLLRALAFQMSERGTEATTELGRALDIAASEGFVQVFVDDGAAIVPLLKKAVREEHQSALVSRVSAALAARETPAAGRKSVSFDTARARAADLVLPEPLSQRELEVLKLIEEGLSNKQICERLFISLSTVKGHNLRIFGKLDVKRRTEAVAKAKKLGIL